MFKNTRKSLIQHGERSELRLHSEWKKVHQNVKNTWGWWSDSVTRQVKIWIGQKLVENAQIEKLKGDTLGDFWTLLASRKKERLDMVFQIFIRDETFSYSIHHFRTLRRAPLTLSNVTLIKEPFKLGLIMQSNLKRNAFSMVLHKRCQSDGV